MDLLTPDEVGRRLSVPSHQVSGIRAHHDGTLATVGGVEYLVTKTVARRYVVEVDGEPKPDDVADDTEDAPEPAEAKAADPPVAPKPPTPQARNAQKPAARRG